MHIKPDAQLLRDYAEHGDEAAFRELAARHTDLIYSSALRQVGSPDLACDVAQSVFTDLARKASSLSQTLSKNASLSGWLYRGTRYAALRQLRDDRRRQARERQVMEQIDPTGETENDWARIQPLLDEAMAELGDDDREALLLRYFKNHDFRAIGSSLGVSDDAAQKRVSRALEKLRADFARRGVTASAAALSAVLSANAVSLAPAGLAATLSTTALAGSAVAAAGLTATTAKAITMTTLQKTFIATTIALLAGGGIYQARHAAQLNEQLELLRQQSHSSSAQDLVQLQHERDDATNQLALLQEQIAALKRNAGDLPKLRREVTELRTASTASGEKDAVQSEAKSWADRVVQLKQRLAQNPGVGIPEFKYLKEANWLSAAREPLTTEKDYRRAFASLRSAGENQFVIEMHSALQKYVKENSGQFPADLGQLKPYFAQPDDADMMQRYAIVPASTIPNMKMGGDSLITVRDPVDVEFDSKWALGERGFGSTSYPGAMDENALASALKAYAAANNGGEPKNPDDILPYLTSPEQKAAFDRLMAQRASARK